MTRAKFLDGMSRAAATVSVVTTDGPAGRAGVTVSAMSAVSADSERPSLLVCVHHLSPAAEAIKANGVFCVNVLRDSQAFVSDTFAGRIRTDSGEKFDVGTWRTLVTGSPALHDALVAFDCRLKESMRYGSHHVFIGELEEAEVAESGPSLIYANRAYGSPVNLGGASASRRHSHVEADAEHVVSFGCFSTLAPYLVPRMLALHTTAHPEVDVRVLEGDQSQLVHHLAVGEADFLLTYVDDLPDTLDIEVIADVPPYVLLPALHPLAHQATVSLRDLVDEPMILLDVPPSRTYFPSLFAHLGLTPQIAYRSRSFEMVRSMVGNGMGFTILGTKPASSTTYDGRAVITRPLSDDLPPSRIALVKRRDSARLSDATETFINRLRQELGSATP
ncbi:MAG: LysR substrate-binding domain-containing protein [Actinomycetes bacterium]